MPRKPFRWRYRPGWRPASREAEQSAPLLEQRRIFATDRPIVLPSVCSMQPCFGVNRRANERVILCGNCSVGECKHVPNQTQRANQSRSDPSRRVAPARLREPVRMRATDYQPFLMSSNAMVMTRNSTAGGVGTKRFPTRYTTGGFYQCSIIERCL